MTLSSRTESTRPTSGGIEWDRQMVGSAGNAAEAYERYLVPGLGRPSAEALIEVAPPSPHDRVLDVGCGTGVVALMAAARVGPAGSVHGVDINPGMLEVARRLPGADRVEWRQGDAQRLPYADASMELVYCQHTLQFVPDRLMAVKEMRRVLTPGGKLGIVVWGPVERSPGYLALSAALAHHIRPEAGDAVRQAPFSLHEPAELASILAAGGFGEVDVRAVDLESRFASADEFLAATLPLVAAIVPAAASMDEASVAALTAEVRRELAGYQKDGRLAFPIQANIGVGVTG